MADDSLVGNVATEAIVNFFRERQISLELNLEEFKESVRLAGQVFPA